MKETQFERLMNSKKDCASIKDLEMELWLRRRNSGLLKWTTKNGEEIALKDMSDEHLKNALNMAYRIEDLNDNIDFAGFDDDWGDR